MSSLALRSLSLILNTILISASSVVYIYNLSVLSTRFLLPQTLLSRPGVIPFILSSLSPLLPVIILALGITMILFASTIYLWVLYECTFSFYKYPTHLKNSAPLFLGYYSPLSLRVRLSCVGILVISLYTTLSPVYSTILPHVALLDFNYQVAPLFVISLFIVASFYAFYTAFFSLLNDNYLLWWRSVN